MVDEPRGKTADEAGWSRLNWLSFGFGGTRSFPSCLFLGRDRSRRTRRAGRRWRPPQEAVGNAFEEIIRSGCAFARLTDHHGRHTHALLLHDLLYTLQLGQLIDGIVDYLAGSAQHHGTAARFLDAARLDPAFDDACAASANWS